MKKKLRKHSLQKKTGLIQDCKQAFSLYTTSTKFMKLIRLKFCSFVLQMTVFMILREAFLKIDNIEVIKCLKLTVFKCKNNL